MPVIIEQVHNSPSFKISVVIMPIVCLILASRIRITPTNKERTHSIELAYSVNI